MNTINRIRAMAFIMVGLCLMSGCKWKMEKEGVSLAYEQWAPSMFDLARLARSDIPGSTLISSYDRKGGNDDFNNYLRKGPEGWIVLADLEGPGYISRFWTTGEDNGQQQVRFYFDNENLPRIDTTLDEFCGTQSPYLSPLAAYEPFCWYSLTPIPYRKRLIIMTTEGGFRPDKSPKLYCQINDSKFPDSESVESFPAVMPASISNSLDGIRRDLTQIMAGQVSFADSRLITNSFALQPGQTGMFNLKAGPALIRELKITLDFAGIPSASMKNTVMRGAVLRIFWDSAAQPSVEVPLGDFFGSVWQPRRFNSAYFGMSNNTFYSRFPMPFKSSAILQIENSTPVSLPVSLQCSVTPLPAWTNEWQYFHAAWNRTSPSDVGRPHPILRARGSGKYVGCILSTCSLDQSWWMLEGDETIRVDGEASPSWHGTGLEDYFNAGWYYGNALVRPFHGIPFKAPWRTIQYRVHQTDPVLFHTAIDMEIERGPQQASHGWMESVAFYYLTLPEKAASRLGDPAARTPPADPLAQATVMNELNNLERLGDYQGAVDYIDVFMEKYPGFPFNPLLKLRQVAYREQGSAFDAVRGEYEKALAGQDNPLARKQLDDLIWYHSSPTNALLGIYCDMRTRVFLDGQLVGEAAADPQRMQFFRTQAGPGRHVLAIEAEHHDYPSWIQACLRTHDQDICTWPDWKFTFSPAGNWATVDYDDSGWYVIGGNEIGKGPPVDPYVWLEPHIFINMHSRATGIFTTKEWPDKRGTAVFRKTFTLP